MLYAIVKRHFLTIFSYFSYLLFGLTIYWISYYYYKNTNKMAVKPQKMVIQLHNDGRIGHLDSSDSLIFGPANRANHEIDSIRDSLCNLVICSANRIDSSDSLDLLDSLVCLIRFASIRSIRFASFFRFAHAYNE